MAADPFWANKNVFITGINGFIGGNLAKTLLAKGARVTGLIRNAHRDTFLYYEKLDQQVTIMRGELTDRELLVRILVEEQIHVVFHLAAQVEVGVAHRYPYLTWETNVRGTYCLMEAAREHPESLQAIVIASSDKAYGEYGKEKMPYREDYPLKPVYPYDVSKACADMIARSYASELYNLPVVITRFCNIFGPGQLNFSALVPDATRCAYGFGDFIPRSDGSQIRDYIFVEDVADLYTVIARALASGEPIAGQVFNVGTNEPRSVRDVVEKIFEIADNPEKLGRIQQLFEGRRTVGEIVCQYMDFKKVDEFFGWRPITAFEDALKKTMAWYRGYLSQIK
jgi:CDP-glucose 4,6-dehydratase